MDQWREIVRDRILEIDLLPRALSQVWTPVCREVELPSRGMLKEVLCAKRGMVSCRMIWQTLVMEGVSLQFGRSSWRLDEERSGR